MALGRPITPVTLSDEAHKALSGYANSRTLPYGLVRRAQMILLAAEGLSNTEIGTQLKVSGWIVGMWRKRFLRQGIMGLYDEHRLGSPRTINDDMIAGLIRQTLETKPNARTRWSCRLLAQQTGFSKSTVQRVWSAFNIQPHRQKSFQLSTDPFFVEKVRDIVGLYLNPIAVKITF
jgi:putative transposase